MEYKVYTRRWYILFVFSIYSLFQSAFWITYSSVVAESTAFFGISEHTVAFLLALGPMVYFASTPPILWAFSKMKNPISNLTVIGAGLTALGATLRCVTCLHPKSTWAFATIIFSQFLICVTGVVVLGAPPKLSSKWFPPNERTMATAISSCSNYFGSAVGFIIPPYIVERYGFINFLVIEAGIAAFIFILTIIYFPESPPHPPSTTAKLEDETMETLTKESFLKTMKDIFTNPSFLLLSIVAGWEGGILNAWQGLFHDIFDPLFSETFVGWLGFIFIAASCVGGVVGGILCDKFFQKKFKKILLILFGLLSICLVVFTLAFPSFIKENSIINMHPYVSATLLVVCGVLHGFCTPIFYEFGVELTYPLSPIISSVFYTLWLNFFILLFLVVPIPNNWLNGVSAISIMASFLPIIFVKESYARSDVDNMDQLIIQ